MKKRIITGLAALFLTGILSACGGNKAVSSSDPQEPAQAQAMEENENQEGSQAGNESQETSQPVEGGESGAEDYPEDLDFLYTELDFGYSIRLLDSYHTYAGYGYKSLEPVDGKIQEHFSEVIYVTQYSGEVGDDEQKERIDMSQYHDSTDIFNLLRPNMEDELFPNEIVSECNVEEKGTKVINGVEMTKFEGNIKTIDKDIESITSEYLFVAYGIAGKKTPVLVCCVDRTEDLSRHAYWVDKIEDVVSTYKDAE